MVGKELPDFDFEGNDFNEIITTLKTKFDTKTICEKLGITISATSGNEIEFSIKCTVKDICDMLKEVWTEQAENLDNISQTIGTAGIEFYVRVNTITTLPVKIDFKTTGLKEALSNSAETKVTVNKADINFKLDFDYNAKKPTVSTEGYTDASLILKPLLGYSTNKK